MINVPNMSVDTNAILQSASGFRSQEAWGRWMIGEKSSIEIFSPYDQNLGLYLNFVLPVSNQRLKISVNEDIIAVFGDQSAPFSYSGQSTLHLKKGLNKILFETNKSNNMTGGKPFAPLDKTDISISFNKILIKKLLINEGQDLTVIYNTYNSTETQSVYHPIMSNTANLYFYGNGFQVLSIDLLKSLSDQSFIISLDDKKIEKIESARNQSLVRRQFVTWASKGEHLLSITSVSIKGPHGVVEETSQKVAEVSGKGVFYIQNINISSKTYDQPILYLGISIFLFIVLLYLNFIFFFKRTSSKSNNLIDI